MKKLFVMLALAWGTMGAFAQTETDSAAVVNKGITPVKEVYPQKEEDGDLYHGLTRKLTFDRMIPPYGLEVTYDKTTHIIFPSSVRYVDLGSPNLIAGKADGAENVIRVKATVKNFREETNMSVITESGSFYTFNVKYAEEPLLLNIEMKDFIHDGSEVNRPNNALDIYLKELGSESPKLVYLISKSVHKDNKRHIKHIGSKAFGIQYLLRGLYTHNGLLYFHTQIRNRSNVPYEVDFVTFKIVDKKVMKRKYSINSLVYWVTYVHNVVYSFYRSMIYCYINSTQRCAGSIVIDIIPTNGADKRKFFPFAPYFPVTNVIKRYFYPYFPAIIGIKGYSFPYFPYLSGIMKIKTALYSLFSRLDWHKTVVFPCLGEIYEGIRSLSWEIPVT